MIVTGWMRVVGELGAATWEYAGTLALGAAFVWMWRAARRERMVAARERGLREELEAYAQLDTSLRPQMGGAGQVSGEKALAVRVCRTIAEQSAFQRVTLLLRNAAGTMRCVGSVGVDDLTLAAIEDWAARVIQAERGDPEFGAGSGAGAAGGDVPGAVSAEDPLGGWVRGNSAKSVPISLGRWGNFDGEISAWAASGRVERRRWRRAIVLPIRTGAGRGGSLGAELARQWSGGRLVGAIVVCSDGLAAQVAGARGLLRVEKLVSGLEMLAEKLGRRMENEALSQRLLRAEKLAGLGQLAGGVAHALNNPLTAVLGFAELIAETSSEPRVQADAQTIATEALRMKETVQRLTEFWRPVTMSNQVVAMDGVLREIASGCETQLKQRGVTLELLVPATCSPVRGNRDRLRKVMEHLLNNAAQAIAAARPREEGEEHRIRMSVSEDAVMLHVIVSDTGTGFEEPGRAFDPFYTTKDPVEGAGMGLSICYGIMREHGGEIAAFNLHPHGAAVVVQVPLARAVQQEVLVTVEEVAT